MYVKLNSIRRCVRQRYLFTMCTGGEVFSDVYETVTYVYRKLDFQDVYRNVIYVYTMTYSRVSLPPGKE